MSPEEISEDIFSSALATQIESSDAVLGDTVFYLLREDGFKFLREDGDFILRE